MTKHSMVTMRLHRKGVILAIVFALVFAILIFAVGYMTGMSRGMKIALKAPAVPKIAVPKVEVPKLPAAVATTTTGTAGQGARPKAGGAPAPLVAIRVGVFPAEEDAKALVQRLAASKITATISAMPIDAGPTDAGPTLYLVLVGRYTSRREAAAAAAELERNEGLNTAVVPIP